eukprot:3752189-Pyramimonas_sp.AAC.1
MISIYLYTGEGRTPRDLALLWEACKYVRRVAAAGYPWLTAGDFNMSPSELFEHDWLHVVQGRRCAPDHPTCLEATPGTLIDFFTLHSSLVDDVPFQ